MSPPTRSCAAALIAGADGRVLLVHQNYGHRFHGLPGGVVDAGETPLEAAVREAREETGVDVEVVELVGLYVLHGGGWPDVLAHVFLCRVTDGEPRVVDPGEIAGVSWVGAAALPSPLTPDTEAGVEDFLAGRRGAVRRVARTVRMEPLR
jgi:ADP-ribose pyrophosphatase YjhB (NUDIX family)